MTTPNVAAFLAMIKHSEGTDLYPDPYRAVFRGEDEFGHVKPRFSFASFADHPAITGEWAGESIAFLGEGYAHSISTAAGAFMITKPTWQSLQVLLRLGDFGPAAQDDAAIELIKAHGALALLNAGDVQAAIAKCSGVWASLPGSRSRQPQARLVTLLDVYTEAGGALA